MVGASPQPTSVAGVTKYSELFMKAKQRTLILALFLCSDLLAQAGAPVTDIDSSVNRIEGIAVPVADSGAVSVQYSNQYYQLQILQDEVRTLRGLLEEVNYQLQQVKQQQMDDYLDIDRRLMALASSTAESSTDVMLVDSDSEMLTDNSQQIIQGDIPATQMADQTLLVDVVDPATIKADYDLASSLLLKNRDLDSAIIAFQKHIDSYPDSPFIPNAYYWLGEIYDLRGQGELALQSFRLVVDMYGNHSKAMDARFKLGKLYHKLGQLELAKELLEVAAQSDGGAAAKARAYLKNNAL